MFECFKSDSEITPEELKEWRKTPLDGDDKMYEIRDDVDDETKRVDIMKARMNEFYTLTRVCNTSVALHSGYAAKLSLTRPSFPTDCQLSRHPTHAAHIDESAEPVHHGFVFIVHLIWLVIGFSLVFRQNSR